MQAHALPLPESEAPRLLPDRVRHADPAEIVRERGAAHEGHGRCGEVHAPRGGLGELGHAGRVLTKPRRLEIGECRDRREGGVDPFTGDPDLRRRLDLERLLPHPRLVEFGEDARRGCARQDRPVAARMPRPTAARPPRGPPPGRRRTERPRCHVRRAPAASAMGSPRRRRHPGTPARPSARRRVRVPPGCPN